MAVSIMDVARAAGVSAGTVSHVLNRNESARIAKSTQDRVWAIAGELGYRPNRTARALVTGKHHAVALIVPQFNAPFLASAGDRMRQVLADEGYELLVGGHHADAFRLTSLVDGVIWLGQANQATSFPISVPQVEVSLAPSSDLDGVDFQLGAATTAALDHVWQAGRRRIAFLAQTGPIDGDGRTIAYRAFARDRGMDSVVSTDVSRLLSSSPEAVFCQTSELARALYAVAPSMVVLAGDDLVDPRLFSPSLSAVKVPLADGVAAAWHLLKQRIADPSLERQTRIVPASFAAGESAQASSSETLPVARVRSAVVREPFVFSGRYG